MLDLSCLDMNNMRCVMCEKPLSEKDVERVMTFLEEHVPEGYRSRVSVLDFALELCCSDRCRKAFKNMMNFEMIEDYEEEHRYDRRQRHES